MTRVRWVVALLVLAVAGCSGTGGTSHALETQSGVSMYCAQQQPDGTVTFAVSVVQNVTDKPATLAKATLVGSTDGIGLRGVYVDDESDGIQAVNGGPFSEPAGAATTVAPGASAVLVVGVSLKDGIHAARADGLRVEYESDGSSGAFTTDTVLQTSEAGPSCDDTWAPVVE